MMAVSVRAILTISAFVMFSGAASRAGDLVADDLPVIQSCEARLAQVLTEHRVVSYPPVFVADCPGGGLGNSASVNVRVAKAAFVQAGSLGDPANWVIEGADLQRVEDSGGPGFSLSSDADFVYGGASCSHGPFGGGVTGKFRLIAKLRDLMNDGRARNIGRLCAALAFHPGVPR